MHLVMMKTDFKISHKIASALLATTFVIAGVNAVSNCVEIEHQQTSNREVYLDPTFEIPFEKDGITYGRLTFDTSTIDLVTDSNKDNHIEIDYTATIDDSKVGQYSFFSDQGTFDINTPAIEIHLENSSNKKVGDDYSLNIGDLVTKSNYHSTEFSDTVSFVDENIILGSEYHLVFDSINVGETDKDNNSFNCDADDYYFIIPSDIDYHSSKNFIENGIIYNAKMNESTTYNKVLFELDFDFDNEFLSISTQDVILNLKQSSKITEITIEDSVVLDNHFAATYSIDRNEFEDITKIGNGNVSLDFDILATNESLDSIIFGFENISSKETFEISTESNFIYESDFSGIIIVDENENQIISGEVYENESTNFIDNTIIFNPEKPLSYDENSSSNFRIKFSETDVKTSQIVSNHSIKSIVENDYVFEFSSIDQSIIDEISVGKNFSFSIEMDLISSDGITPFVAESVVTKDNGQAYLFFAEEPSAKDGIGFLTIIIIILIVAIFIGIIVIVIVIKRDARLNTAAMIYEEHVSKAMSGYLKMKKYFDWASSVSDAEIKKVFGKNEQNGSLKMETIEAFEHLEDLLSRKVGINMIWRSLYKLPKEYYSSSVANNTVKFKKLDENFDKIVKAKNSNHIDSLDTVLTLRVGLNEYSEMIGKVLDDIASLKSHEADPDKVRARLCERGIIKETAIKFKNSLN